MDTQQAQQNNNLTGSAKLKEEITKAIKNIDNVQDKIKIVAINNILDKKKALDQQLEKDMRELQIKYDKLSQPLINDQNKIVAGERTLTQEELAMANNYLNEEEQKQIPNFANNQEKIKDYWFKAMKHSDVIGNEILEKDEEALKLLTKICYNLIEGTDNFQLEFHFSQNQYFENEVLKKSFFLKEDEEIEKTEGTEVEWKKGKNLTVKTVKKTQKNKKSGAKRIVTKEVEDDSFFNFFKNSSAPTHGDGKKEEDDEEFFKAEEKLNIDFDIGRQLIDEIIPYSLEYYLDVKEKEEEGSDVGEEGDSEDGFQDADDKGEDGDDDEEEAKPKKKADKSKKHKKSSDSQGDKTGGDKQEKAECKQQ